MFSINAERDFYKALFTVSEKIDGSYDNMLIAGGACRDSLLDKKIKDFDVFILNPSKTLQNKIKKHAFPSGKYTLGSSAGMDEVKYETWNISDNIQVILSVNQNVNGLLKSFDYDFNQLGFTTDQVYATEAFENFYFQDDDINYVTLLNNSFDSIKGNSTVINRLLNFTFKFPEYSFRDNKGISLDTGVKDILLDSIKYKGSRTGRFNLVWEDVPREAVVIGVGQRGQIRDGNLHPHDDMLDAVPREINPAEPADDDDRLREAIARMRHRLNF